MESASSNSLCFICTNSYYNGTANGSYQNPGVFVWHLYSGNTSTRTLTQGCATSCKLEINNTLVVGLVNSLGYHSASQSAPYRPGLFLQHIPYDTTLTGTNVEFSAYK